MVLPGPVSEKLCESSFFCIKHALLVCELTWTFGRSLRCLILMVILYANRSSDSRTRIIVRASRGLCVETKDQIKSVASAPAFIPFHHSRPSVLRYIRNNYWGAQSVIVAFGLLLRRVLFVGALAYGELTLGNNTH